MRFASAADCVNYWSLDENADSSSVLPQLTIDHSALPSASIAQQHKIAPRIHCLAFNHNNSFLLSGGTSGALLAHDVHDGKQRLCLTSVATANQQHKSTQQPQSGNLSRHNVDAATSSTTPPACMTGLSVLGRFVVSSFSSTIRPYLVIHDLKHMSAKHCINSDLSSSALTCCDTISGSTAAASLNSLQTTNNHPHLVVSGNRLGRAHIHNLQTSVSRGTLAHDSDHSAMTSVHFLPVRGMHCVTSHESGAVHIFDCNTTQWLSSVGGNSNAHIAPCTSIALCKATQVLLSASLDCTVRLYDSNNASASTGVKYALRDTIRCQSPVSALAIDPTGQRCLAGTLDGALHLYDVRLTRRPLLSLLKAHAMHQVNQIAFENATPTSSNASASASNQSSVAQLSSSHATRRNSNNAAATTSANESERTSAPMQSSFATPAAIKSNSVSVPLFSPVTTSAAKESPTAFANQQASAANSTVTPTPALRPNTLGYSTAAASMFSPLSNATATGSQNLPHFAASQAPLPAPAPVAASSATQLRSRPSDVGLNAQSHSNFTVGIADLSLTAAAAAATKVISPASKRTSLGATASPLSSQHDYSSNSKHNLNASVYASPQSQQSSSAQYAHQSENRQSNRLPDASPASASVRPSSDQLQPSAIAEIASSLVDSRLGDLRSDVVELMRDIHADLIRQFYNQELAFTAQISALQKEIQELRHQQATQQT